jgi:hypothetical protein
MSPRIDTFDFEYRLLNDAPNRFRLSADEKLRHRLSRRSDSGRGEDVDRLTLALGKRRRRVPTYRITERLPLPVNGVLSRRRLKLARHADETPLQFSTNQGIEPAWRSREESAQDTRECAGSDDSAPHKPVTFYKTSSERRHTGFGLADRGEMPALRSNHGARPKSNVPGGPTSGFRCQPRLA